MIIAAFDLATETGCCDGPVDGTCRLWSWFLRDGGDTRGGRLHHLAGFLTRYFTACPVDAVVYEAPMQLGAMHRIGAQEATVAFLRGAIGVLEERCFAFHKQVAGITAQDARSSVLGWRLNKKGTGELVKRRDGSVRDEGTKERVMAGVRHYGVNPGNDNEADAFVVWRCACNQQNPRLAVASTPLFAERGA